MADREINTGCLDRLDIRHHVAVVDGEYYVVTSGTGDGVFAYAADAIEAESVRVRSDSELRAEDRPGYDYEEFCLRVTPETERDLAVALAALEDTRIHEPGSCNPVLTADEYALIRKVAELLT